MSVVSTDREVLNLKSVCRFLNEKGSLYARGNSRVHSDWVQEYLDEFIPIKIALLDQLAKKERNPALFNILERFLNLTDERKEDGSIDRRMLCYHIRFAQRLCMHYLYMNVERKSWHLMKLLIGINFNKPSALDYYRKRTPKLVAEGTIPKPYDFRRTYLDFAESLEIILHLLLPGKLMAYDNNGESLKDCIIGG